MEVLRTVFSAVRTLLAALQIPELDYIRSIDEYRSQLDDLQRTVEAIGPVLREVFLMKEFLSHEDMAQILEIKDAIFEADDLLDEFVTIAQQQLAGTGGTYIKDWFKFGPLSLGYRMSQGLKKIRKKLDAIAYNHRFSFKHDPQPIRNRRPDTCSYAYEFDIIGREDDLEKIVGMLLDPSNDNCDVSFLSIVGVGGLGKTALAQLVFNDPRIKSAFQWRNWTCVADQDRKDLDVKEILSKILDKNPERFNMEYMQTTLQRQIAEKRWLLVLDDVWTENCYDWRDLAKLLVGGQRGSWVVVTTRSHKTATIVGGQMYELLGLSKKNSWLLFERVAFTSDQSSNPSDEMLKIGREIVDGCARVPLAIRVVGSLLYGQDMGKWRSVLEIGSTNIRESENSIIPILKLSFHHLESPLKNCFVYCALFPKDFEMDKEMLKSLWMAQGYIVPLDEGQSIEDACEEYFSILLRRCFFQDIKKDDFNEIYSCKVHDLMHDIALDVSGKEIFYAIDTIRGNLNKNVRHLLVASMREYGNYSLSGNKTHIRSLLHVDSNIGQDTLSSMDALLANCRFLRALLDLHSSGFQSLSGCIGELLHLRYLDLSYNDLHVLPKSIAKLSNLQTLNLRGCVGLRELPKDLSRLVKLRFLDISRCINLEAIPNWMPNLTSLTTHRNRSCSDSLKQRCQKDPPGEDWPNIQHIPNISPSAIRGMKSNEDATSCMQKPSCIKKSELLKPNRWNTLSLTLRAIARMKIMVQERYMVLYCLLFGDIYEFEREKLIQLWMAAGFLKREPMEDRGDRFFEFLLENMYILPSRIGILRQSNLYKVNSEMIPYIRGRADSIKDFTMRIGDNATANQFADLWHISVQSSNINQSFKSLKKISMVKTLLLLNGSLLTRVPPDFFSTFNFLTALDLSGSRITELPSSIQDAKELCYVDFSGSPINRLPQTIVHLRRLQTLRLKGCTDLFELPERTKELINLRHLVFDVLSQLTLMPRGIGHLTELRTLHAFIVDGQIVDGEKRCNIKELKLMNNLSGTLCISGLEHATSQDAEAATLINKKRLKHLELRWSDLSECFPEEELVRVIQGLKPHSSLEELKIVCYPGECLPNWIGDPQYEWLVSITLFKCENCSNFPCLGRLPQLKNLEIFEMNGVKKIDHTSYGDDIDRATYHALEKLSIDGMYRVEEWKGLRDGDFPCLVKLIINRCPSLALLSSFPRCQSLKHLEIADCPQLKCLPDDMLSSPLDSLVIDDCPLLREIYSKGGEDSHKTEHVKNVWIESEETESSDKHSTSTEDDSINGTHQEDYRDESD